MNGTVVPLHPGSICVGSDLRERPFKGGCPPSILTSHQKIGFLVNLLPQSGQVTDPRQQVGMRGVLELLTRVGARKHANLPADSGIPPGLQVEHGITHHGYLVDAGLAGRFDSAENQVRRWATLRNVIPTDDGGDSGDCPVAAGRINIIRLSDP